MNQYKERITRLRDRYNAEIAASSSFYDEPEYTAHLPFPPDDDEHVGACADIIADAYRNGDYTHMWESLTEALDERDDPHDELTYDILAEAISELQWDIQPINSDALNNAAFAGMALASMTLLPVGRAGKILGLIIGALVDGDDMEYANSLAIMEQAACIVLANMPTSGDSDTQRIRHSLPTLRHQSIADYIMRKPDDQETSLTRLGSIILRDEATAGASVEDAGIFFVNADTNSVCEAAQRWRDAIARAEEHGDSEAETSARRAHAHVCLILMHRCSLPHKELATLIDTTQTPTAGAKAFTIVISPEVWRIQIDTVEQLIDYAATRMSAAL